MGLPTSKMQADFHPPPKLGLDYFLYGLSESQDRDSCRLGMLLRTGQKVLRTVCIPKTWAVCAWQPHGQNSPVQSPGPASE